MLLTELCKCGSVSEYQLEELHAERGERAGVEQELWSGYHDLTTEHLLSSLTLPHTSVMCPDHKKSDCNRQQTHSPPDTTNTVLQFPFVRSENEILSLGMNILTVQSGRNCGRCKNV